MRILSLVSIYAVIISCHTAFAQNPAKDPFLGTFSGSSLTLTLQNQNGSYTGQAMFQGQNLSVTAKRVNEAMIYGTYTFQGQQLPFQAKLQGNKLTLLAGGETYVMTRQRGNVDSNDANPKSQPVPSSPTQPGKFNLRAGEVGDPYWGLKFSPPQGWVDQKAEQGFLLGCETKKGFILILPHEHGSLNELRAAAKEGLADENGTMLQVDGEIKSFGENGVAANFRGTVEWQKAKAYAIGLLSPFGGGATILTAVTEADFSEEYIGFTESLAKSMKFSKPEIPPVTEEWKQRLAGARLTYLWSYYSGGSSGSYAGGSQKTTIDLCQQGYFNFSDNNELAVDGGFGSGYNASGYGGGSDRGNGRWEITARGQQPILKLKFHDGRVFEYVLSIQDGKTYLDDKRYFRTYSGDPVEEHRPQCW